MEPEADRKQDKRKALLGTVIFHAVLAVLFIFFGLKEPHPPKKEKMVSIDMNYGTDLKGMGEQESQSEEEQKNAEQQEEEPEQQAEEQATSEDVATQEEAPVDAKEEEEGKETSDEAKEQEEEEEEKPEVSEELKEAQDRFKDMEDDGGGEGDDGVSGNEGNPEGKPQGEGSLPGAGGSWKLSGRKILQKPQPKKPDEEGKVVIDIWVDQNGNVIRTSPNLSRSNTTSDKLLKLAQDAAKKAKFNPSPDAAVEQKGTFTFVFELR